MDIKWDDTQKVTQAVAKMHNRNFFDKKQIIEWEDKDDVNNTWGVWQMFFKKYYKLKKRYSNGRPDLMGFESAANVAENIEMESDKLKNYLDGLSDATRADKEQMNQMASTNDAMVELCQYLTEVKIQQCKQIIELILQVAKLTKLLTEKRTNPAGSDCSKCTAASQYKKCDTCKKTHKKGMYWEDEANKAIQPENWKSTLE